MTDAMKCPGCGTPVKVVGRTTQHYEPIWKEQTRPLIECLKRIEEGFKSFSEKQHKLLVEGQNLESASENWEKFPEAFSFDFSPLFEMLAKYKASVGKEQI